LNQTTQRILDEVARLSPIERAEIIDRILESFDAEPDSGIAEAWVKEAERRLADYRAGEMSSLPEEEVFRRIEKSVDICKTCAYLECRAPRGRVD